MRVGTIVSLVIAGFVTLFGLSACFGSFYTVDEGERGVLLRNGAVTGVANPGLGWKLPFIDDVVSFSVQTKSVYWTPDQFAAYSRDQQTANMRVSINYRLDPTQVEEIYATYGSEEGVVQRLIQPRVFEELKTIFGQFTAASAIQERGRLNVEAETAIAKSVAGPVFIEGVQLEDVNFSDAYEKSIEDRMLAEVEVQKLRQNAEREKVQAEIAVTQATARADATRAEAQAAADAIFLKGEAEAKSIDLRGEALRQNPTVIDLTQAERWDGRLPATMLPGGTVPFLDLSRHVAAE